MFIMLPVAVFWCLLVSTRSFVSGHIENNLEDATVEIRPEEVLEHSTKREGAEEVLRTAGVLDYLLELLEDKRAGADIESNSDDSVGVSEERDPRENSATVSAGGNYEEPKHSRVGTNGDVGFEVPVPEAERYAGQTQAAPADSTETFEADPTPAMQNAARTWQSLDDTVITEATNLVFEALYKRKPSRKAQDADPSALPPPPSGLCVRSCGVPNLAGWYELNGTFGGAPAFSRERPGTMGHTVQIIRYGHKSGAKYWYLSDLKNRSLIEDDEDFWRTTEPSHSSLPPIGTPEAWTTLSTAVWSGSDLLFSTESDRASCEAATFETRTVAMWAAAIPVLEALLEHDYLLTPLVILTMISTINFVRLARLPALGRWLYMLGARAGLTGWRGTVAGLAALLLAQHVQRIDWATNVAVAVDALISVWALPFWLNLGRLAATSAFHGARWLLLGPLTREEEAGQWALFYEEGSGMLTLIGCVGLWLPDDSMLAFITLFFLAAIAFFSLVASIAVNRMQQLLGGGATANTATGGRANEAGLTRLHQRFFRGLGHPSQMMAHCRLFGSLFLGQATVVGLMLVMMRLAVPEGLTDFQLAIWRFKILLLFVRASKKSVRGLVHYAIIAYGNVPRSHLWHVMVAKSLSLATDAVECAGVGLLFGLNLCSGLLSVSTSDFIYAMWVRSLISQVVHNAKKHGEWLVVFRALEATYRSATSQEIASTNDVCVICHDDLCPNVADSLDTVVVLPACQHLFHRGCFQSFLESATEGHLELKCPICRQHLAPNFPPAASPTPNPQVVPVAPGNRHEAPVAPAAAPVNTFHPAPATHLPEATTVEPGDLSAVGANAVVASADPIVASEDANYVTLASQVASTTAAAGPIGPDSASNVFRASEESFSPSQAASSCEPPSFAGGSVPQKLTARAAAAAAAEARAAIAAGASISVPVPQGTDNLSSSGAFALDSADNTSIEAHCTRPADL